MNRCSQHAVRRGGALILLLFSWGLLLFRLGQVPPGFQHDQTFSALDAMQVLGGHYPIYFPDNFGRGPLFMYTVAGVFGLTGGHYVWSLHFAAVLWGMLGLALTLPLARRYLPYWAALFATALMAGSYWFLLAARLGVESIALLPLAAGMVYFLDRGFARRSPAAFAVAGILGGIANYTYLASRTLYLLVPLLAIYVLAVWLWHRRRRAVRPSPVRMELAGLLLAFVLMLAVSGPLLVYLDQHPGTDGRLGELSGPLLAAAHGDLAPMQRNSWDTVRSLLLVGSSALPYHYGIPGRPALQPIWAACFLIGLLITLARAGRRHEFLLLAALVLGLSSSLLTGADALYMRGIYSLPLLFILAVRGLWAIPRVRPTPPAPLPLRAPQRGGQARTQAVPKREGGDRTPLPEAERGWGWGLLAVMLLAGLLAWHVWDGGVAYFKTWATAEQTQRIYNADFRAAAAWLDANAQDEPVYIGTDRLLDLDRRTYGFYEPKRTDANWFLLPDSPALPAQGSALYLLPAAAKLPATLDALGGISRDRFWIAGDEGRYNLMQGFRIYAADVAGALQQKGAQPLDRPVIFGDALRLDQVGVVDRGEYAEVSTVWTVLGPWPRSARPGYPPARPKLSVQVSDEAGYRWAQADETTSLPFQTWQAGEQLVEITRVSLPGDMPPGRYAVRLAMYDDEQGPLDMRYADKALVTPPVVGAVQIASAGKTDAPEPPFPAAAQDGNVPLRLLGQWERLGALTAGLPADLHLSWQAARPLDTTALHFRVRALADGGTLLWEQSADPLEPLTGTWPAGRILRLTHRLEPRLSQAGAEQARLEICAMQAANVFSCAEIGQAQVANPVRLTSLPAAPQHAYHASWGNSVALAGYDLVSTGEGISLTLYWQAGSAPAGAPKRFVHAISDDQAILAQSDAGLETQGIPPAYWRPGEYVVDRVALKIPPGKVAIALHIGLYDPETGDRLAVELATGDAPTDRVVTIPLQVATP